MRRQTGRVGVFLFVMLFTGVARSWAQCSPSVDANQIFWSLPGGIMIVGASGTFGPPDPAGVCVIHPKNNIGLSMINVPVTIEWDDVGFPYSICSTQNYPGMSYTHVGGVQAFTANTDASGDARFCITGGAFAGACGSWPFDQSKVRVKVCGVQVAINPFIKPFVPSTANLDNSGGVTSSDLSAWLSDFFCYDPNTGTGFSPRSDLDGTGTIGPADYSKLLSVYFGNGSLVRCP